MLKINLEFKRGILFIRLSGVLNKNTIEKFNNEVISIVLKDGIKLIVVNLDELISIDQNGINSLNELNEIVNQNKGKSALCSLTNNEVKTRLEESDCSKLYYETSNELTAIGEMKI